MVELVYEKRLKSIVMQSIWSERCFKVENKDPHKHASAWFSFFGELTRSTTWLHKMACCVSLWHNKEHRAISRHVYVDHYNIFLTISVSNAFHGSTRLIQGNVLLFSKEFHTSNILKYWKCAFSCSFNYKHITILSISTCTLCPCKIIHFKDFLLAFMYQVHLFPEKGKLFPEKEASVVIHFHASFPCQNKNISLLAITK